MLRIILSICAFKGPDGASASSNVDLVCCLPSKQCCPSRNRLLFRNLECCPASYKATAIHYSPLTSAGCLSFI